MIHCLMTNSQLNDKTRAQLYIHARDMITSKQNHITFHNKYASGVVKTQYKYGFLGNIYGTICEAELHTDTNAVKIKVSYIITTPFLNDQQIKDSEWISVEEYNELISKNMKTDPAYNAHNN